MRHGLSHLSLAALGFLLVFSFPRFLTLRAQTVMDTQPETLPAQPHPEGWWPNEASAARSAYAGPQSCASCHPAEYKGWEASEMAHAITSAASSAFLRAHPHLAFHRGPYTYRIDVEGDQAVYSVTKGRKTLSVPLLWAYGTGIVGQAFVFRISGIYYEAEVAFYPIAGGLDVVAGLERAAPPALEQAFGLPLTPQAARECISCHTTAAVTSGELHICSLIAGVTCEACHGPGKRHVEAMRALSKEARPAPLSIFDPARLDPSNLENFCGACHRTSLLVVSEGLHGLDTVHYEPYRLEMSQCWIMTQKITCVDCHDPHQPLQPNPAAYDAACLRCHFQAAAGRAESAGRVCPVATHRCAACHMPKCRLPLSPFTMADHFIRVVRAGDPCDKSQ